MVPLKRDPNLENYLYVGWAKLRYSQQLLPVQVHNASSLSVVLEAL